MLEAIVGPMYSEKTSELIRRLTKMEIAKKRVMVFKPSVDTRWGITKTIKSHSGSMFPAFEVTNSHEAYVHFIGVEPSYDVVGFDEIQFFDEGIVQVVKDIMKLGTKVIVSGLDQDFKGEPFGTSICKLLALADRVDKMTAVCVVCSEDATKTQRLINNKPASSKDPIIIVGEKDLYEARCRKCHIFDE